jgi:nicotinate-nucleotide pyrophosphorylase (carboxylating)
MGISSPYDDAQVTAIIHAALHEDLAFGGDITCRGLVPANGRLTGSVIAKAAGVCCGLPLFDRVWQQLGGGVDAEMLAADGDVLEPGQTVLRFEGPAERVLVGERTALNLVQRLSGTATAAKRYADVVAGTAAKIFDTRKTNPGLRLLQKHAVVCGGAENHRIGLFDQVLIKENHIALMEPAEDGSSPAAAVRRCRERLGDEVIIEVEIERLDDLEPVLQAGADIVLLDNMGPELLRQAVAIRGQRAAQLEASGGITLETLRAVAESGVERISVGALTHSAPAFDFSMRCEPVAP